jgi:hypothetical protein
MDTSISLFLCFLSFFVAFILFYKVLKKYCMLQNDIIYIVDLENINPPLPNPPSYESAVNDNEPPEYNEVEDRDFSFTQIPLRYEDQINYRNHYTASTIIL